MDHIKDPIVTFCIPLAPKSKIDYWDDAMVNLNRTLRSLDNQTSDKYNTILVGTYHDIPDLDRKYRNTTIENIVSFAEFSEDKDRKTRVGLEYHLRMGAKYFFRLDWDDLIHKDFVKYCEDNNHEHGYMIQKGYFYRPDICGVIPFDNYWTHCGSSYAINYSKEECLNGPKDGFHHQRVPFYRNALGKPLALVNFRAGAYVIHGNNISKPKHDRIFKDAVWEDTFKYENFHEVFGI